jgi:Fic family protein
MKDKFNLTLEENVFLAKRQLISSIYMGAKIEGLNVTFYEVQNILEGVNVPNVKLDEINTILNLRDAWKYVLDNIKEEISLDFILKINSYVSRNESLSWGVLRTGNVGISGTDYIPKIPEEQEVKQEIEKILAIPNITLRSIKYMLYGMRNQLFWDGNKRTSMIIANKIMIMNGKGIILIKDENLLEFNKLLTDYYTNGLDSEIIEFLYNKCIYGLE